MAALDESWVGLSVTMPHKGSALALSDSVDLLASATGAVNTLVFSRDARGARHITGYNTDVSGMVNALADGGVSVCRNVAVLGGGATASSAIVAAAELGAATCTVLVRDVLRAEFLMGVGESVGVATRIHDFKDMATLEPIDLAISTLPGNVDVSLKMLPRVPGAALLDVAYSPWPSVRGEEWNQNSVNGVVISGLAMLAHQALTQVRLFVSGDATLELPDEARVRSAMFAAVGLS